MRRSRLRATLLGSLAVGGLVLSGCSQELPLNTLDPKGSGARSIDNLISPVFIVAGIVFLFVNVGVLYVAVKYRRRKGQDDFFPKQIHGNTKLELSWTILPAVILAVVTVFTIATLFNLYKVRTNTLTVEVQGQQWWWSFRYDIDGDGKFDGPEDITTPTELAIPTGTEVALRMTSNDVIHSFWIPQLNGKRDVVPGSMHNWWVQADDPGYFLGQCTEFCGLSHAYMRMAVKAMPQAEFDQWVRDQQAAAQVPEDDEAAMRGLDDFVTNCASCHQIEGVNTTGCNPLGQDFALDEFDPDSDCYKGVAAGWEGATQVSGNAPNLTHLMSRQRFIGGLYDLYQVDSDGEPIVGEDGEKIPDVNEIKGWIRDPEQYKPMAPNANQFSTYGRGMPKLPLTEDQLDDLAAYLVTLK